jgi:hypothetical protein
VNTTTSLCPVLEGIWASAATAEAIVEHAASHDCNTAQVEFYLGYFDLNAAGTIAQASATIDRCERAAQAMPDLRFALVEQVLTVFADEATGPWRAFALERQRELRARWTTLPCRPLYGPTR